MTVRNILILSRIKAEVFDPSTEAPAALVSITNPDDTLPNFVHGWRYDFIWRYQFHDVTANAVWNSGDSRYKAMTLAQAQDLALMLRIYDPYFSTLVIHGSAAIALAVAEWKELYNIVRSINNSMHYLPNGHVLTLMRKALETDKESKNRQAIEDMYAYLFEGRLVPWSLEEK